MTDLIGAFIRARRKNIDRCEKKLKLGHLTDLQRKYVQWRLSEELSALRDLLQDVQARVVDDRALLSRDIGSSPSSTHFSQASIPPGAVDRRSQGATALEPVVVHASDVPPSFGLKST